MVLVEVYAMPIWLHDSGIQPDILLVGLVWDPGLGYPRVPHGGGRTWRCPMTAFRPAPHG